MAAEVISQHQVCVRVCLHVFVRVVFVIILPRSFDQLAPLDFVYLSLSALAKCYVYHLYFE